jgi:hypothetical protein
MISKRQIISDEQIAAAVIAGVLLIFFCANLAAWAFSILG